MIWILAKESMDDNEDTGRLVPFRWNLLQRDLSPRMTQRNRILKGRQQGITTFMLIVRLLIPIITDLGRTGMLVAHNSMYAGLIFGMAHRAFRYFGVVDPRAGTDVNALNTSLRQHLLHTVYRSRRELYFDMLDSRLIVESAEVEEAGQSVTLHHLVASEVPRWPGNPEETMSNLIGALTKNGTRDEEGTANGAAGYFYERFMSSLTDPAHADATPFYYSWYWTEDYKQTLTPKQARELARDLNADEIKLIGRMHHELDGVSWVPTTQAN